MLVDNDRDHRLLACTLYQPQRANQVYVHAKVGIVDDRWLVVGSANLNAHSFYNDTEACVITCDEALARSTRERLWCEHRAATASTASHTRSSTAFSARRPRIPTTTGWRSSPTSRAAHARFLGPLNGLLVDG